MMESPAFGVLNLWEHRFLDCLEIKLCHQGGTDNGKLTVTFQDFVDYGINRKAVSPSRRAVEALGFIKVPRRGRGGNREYREASSYLLTYKPTDNANPTDDWRRIENATEAKRIVTAARLAKDPEAVARSIVHSGKQKAGGQNGTVSGAETHPENTNPPGVETAPSSPGVETHPSVYISSEYTEQPPREARPLNGAVASGAATTSPALVGRADVLQAAIAGRLGRDGWPILQGLEPGHLQNLMALQDCGDLGEEVLAALRRDHRRKEVAA